MESDGAFMLGNEQDCYGGCTDSTQAFYGLMDEVSIFPRTKPCSVTAIYISKGNEVCL